MDAIQDFYPTDLSYCYGCGRLNAKGLQIKSRWLKASERISVAQFTPRPEHTAIPGFVYGGLLASLIDCHGTGTAAMAAYQAENRTWDSTPPNRFVTAALQTSYLLPTPIALTNNLPADIKLIGEVSDIKLKNNRVYKVIVQIKLFSEIDEFVAVRVTGEVVAIQMPESFTSLPDSKITNI